jgi:DeoR/GlpR family transcriptional regulator of sugar metabolism
MTNFADSRRRQIVDLLNRAENTAAAVSELSRSLGVSEMTIRRDLDWLARRGLVTRVHGGAVLYKVHEERPFGDRLKEANLQKKSIGWAAAQLIEDGDRIILDAGTTARHIALHLDCKKNLTVITNNLAAATELSRCGQVETILLGGSLKHQELCTVGPMVKQGLAALSADKFFLAAAGLTLKHGATDLDLREVEVKQAMMAAAAEVILVTDSSKWGQTRLARIAGLEQIHRLVTDDAFPAEALASLEEAGLKVITPRRLGRVEDGEIKKSASD